MDNLLLQTTFSYPIYRIETEFRYRKVGTPSVFDELLMGLAHGDFPQLENCTLERIADVLQLELVFIRYALENLLDTGLIEGMDLPENLTDLPLSDLKLTANGNKFYREKKMPGRRKTEDAVFWFNPLSRMYEKQPKNTTATPIALDNALFPIDENLLLELSKQEITKLSWYETNVMLEQDGISHDYRYDYDYFNGRQNVAVKLTLDHNRYLEVSSEDRLFSEWLATRTPEIIKEHLLKPMLDKAEEALQWDIELDYPEDLLSLTLADQPSDMSAVKNAVAVKFADWQEFDKKTPLVVFSNVPEAYLEGRHLYVPANLTDLDGITQRFFRFQSDSVWIEETGYLPCYFNHQPYSLPVKMLYETQQDWFSELDAFIRPNQATLAFMANFIPDTDIVEKLPEMTMSEAESFVRSVKDTWNKDFTPEVWAEKILPFSDKDEAELFMKRFPKAELHLARFDETIFDQLFDWAVDNEKSPAGKIPELAELLMLYKALAKLNSSGLTLKDVNSETLNKVKQWQENCRKIRNTYARILDSDGIQRLSENLSAWSKSVSAIFEAERKQRKFAVLDTNFIRRQPEKLVQIRQERTVILPKTVLDELDYQKETVKKAETAAEILLKAKSSAVQTAREKTDDLKNQIENTSNELNAIEAELTAVQQQLQVLRAKEQTNG